MTVSRGQAVGVALGALSPSERNGCPVYLDTAVHRRGDILRAGPSEVRLASASYVFFVDLEPGVNWSHPSRVIVVNEADGGVTSHDVRFPPSESLASDAVRLVHRPPSLETWKLLTEKAIG